MKGKINLSEEEWDGILQEHPELGKKVAKMNLMVGGSSKIKYGDNYESYAGGNWQKTLMLGALEGGLAILALIGLSLGIGFVLMGTLKMHGWEAFGGAILTCVGIVAAIVAWHLHDRI
jgi:hypothetical protein